MNGPNYQPYNDKTVDACNDIRDLVDDIIKTGRHYWPLGWTEDELKELKRWAEKQVEGQ